MIYLIKLVTGEWVISKMAGKTDESNIRLLVDPVKIVGQQGQDNQVIVSLVPYVPFHDNVQNFEVGMDKIVGFIELEEGELMNQYKQVLSPLDLRPVKSNKIVTGAH